jgi:hypothetical protein
MGRLGYSQTLIRDLIRFAMRKKAYWLIPLVLILLLTFALIVAGQAAAPFMYTIF